MDQQQAKLKEKLMADIAKGLVVTIAGTGISIQACQGHSMSAVATWKGLIDDGIAYYNSNALLSDKDHEELLAMAASGDAGLLIKAAEWIYKSMTKSGDTMILTWLKNSLGKLQPLDKSVPMALHALPGILTTLNYDSLIEQATGRTALSWTDKDAVIDLIRDRPQDVVLHLHGYYLEPKSIVFGTESYLRVVKDQHAQSVNRLFFTGSSVLFVGCGETIADPNFSQLLSWLRDAHSRVEAHHYFLCRNSERKKYLAALENVKQIEVMGYGDDYKELAPFLRSLAPSPAAGSNFATTVENEIKSIKTITYITCLAADTQHIELRGINKQAPIKLPVADSYVPLRGVAKRVDQVGESKIDVELSQILDNPKLGNGRHLVITGGAGSGKSTVLRHMAWALSTALSTANTNIATQHLGLNKPLAELPLPLFAPLAALASIRNAMQKEKHPRHGASESLEDLITYYLIDEQKYDVPEGYVSTLLDNHREVILLLDGMDEVADDSERALFRNLIDRQARAHACLRVVATCRTVAYNGQTPFSTDFKEIAVQRLEQEHVTKLVEQAYDHMQGAANDRALGKRNLLVGIKALEDERKSRLRDQYLPLVDSPLMVRVLLIVQSGDPDATLPNSRAALFDKAVESLLNADYGPDVSVNVALSKNWDTYREMLQQLAFYMHQKAPSEGRSVKDQGVVSIGATELQSKAFGENSPFEPHVETVIRTARGRASLLEDRGGFRFIHLAFQEFLVARYLCRVKGKNGFQPVLDFLEPKIEDPWWREIVLQAAGYWAIRENDPTEAHNFLYRLSVAGTNQDAQFAAAELAATAVREWPASGNDLRQHCAQRIADLLSEEKTPGAIENSQPAIRARAALAMSNLGDPRFHGPELLCLPKDTADTKGTLGFEEIPADEYFMIGTRAEDRARVMEAFDAAADWITDLVPLEINDTPTPTRHFYMARFPVTVAQYEAFLRDKYPLIEESRHPYSRGAPSLPVTGVDRMYVNAYCTWLNERLIATGDYKKYFKNNKIREFIETEKARFALPSELEWEKAARGGANAIFPWGDKADPNRANYLDSRIGEKSVVGCFQGNGYKLHDMIGNVSEWMRVDRGIRYDSANGRENLNGVDDYRLLRGGSWWRHPLCARCACRLTFDPSLSWGDIGFRVVLRSTLL